MPQAKSISAADLTKFTQAAVKEATKGIAGRFIGLGPTMGFVLGKNLRADQQLALADKIVHGISATAKVAGVSNLKIAPTVVIRPDKIIVGFLPPTISLPIV